MSVDHLTVRARDVPTPDGTYAAPRLAKATIFLGCLAIGPLATATAAAAHVKWFASCNVADTPLPLPAVFTTAFWLLAALFMALFYLGCDLERSAFGATIATALDGWTAPLHRRADDLLRGATAIFFALLWADGSIILTPELKGSGVWLSTLQLLVPIFLFTRATMAAAAAGIVALYACGIATHGLFHMLDYLAFVGLAACLALSVSRHARLRARRFDVLRWTVAFSLLWPSMEKFVYPTWIAPIALAHPQLTLGIDVATFITAAGVVEFGLALALLWTPLVRRLAALALAFTLVAATFEFGKVDAVGHLLIITALLLVFAEPGKEEALLHPAGAPLVGAAGFLATLFVYTGSHTLYYAAWRAALVPLATGVVLLAIVALIGAGSRMHWSWSQRAGCRECPG